MFVCLYLLFMQMLRNHVLYSLENMSEFSLLFFLHACKNYVVSFRHAFTPGLAG